MNTPPPCSTKIVDKLFFALVYLQSCDDKSRVNTRLYNNTWQQLKKKKFSHANLKHTHTRYIFFGLSCKFLSLHNTPNHSPPINPLYHNNNYHHHHYRQLLIVLLILFVQVKNFLSIDSSLSFVFFSFSF